MSENSAVIRIIANHTKEMNELLDKNIKLLSDNADYELMVGQLKKENKALKKLLEVRKQ